MAMLVWEDQAFTERKQFPDQRIADGNLPSPRRRFRSPHTTSGAAVRAVRAGFLMDENGLGVWIHVDAPKVGDLLQPTTTGPIQANEKIPNPCCCFFHRYNFPILI